MSLYGPLEKNVTEGLNWLEKAGANSNTTALYELGKIYFDGEFVQVI